MSAVYPFYTLEEVAMHNSETSCWLVAHDRVYDVTPWLELHPAGKRSILRHAGKECSRDFDFHSRAAQQLWASFRVGTLHGTTPDAACVIL